MTAAPASAPGPAPSVPLDRRAVLLAGHGLGAASMVIWAAGFPAADALLDTWPPLLLVAARFVVALLALLPFWLLRDGIPRGTDWLKGLGVGALGIGGGAVCLVYAQALSDPVTAAVFASVSPLTGTLVEVWFRERRLRAPFLAGAALSVAGGVVAAMGSGLPSGSLLTGAALAAASCVLYSWGSHETVRLMPGRSTLGQTAATMLGAMLASVVVGGFSLAGGSEIPALGWPDLGLLLLYGVGGMAISQVLFVASISRIGVALASFHINAAPFYVMLILLALGGGWDWWQALGAAIVAVGVLVAARG